MMLWRYQVNVNPYSNSLVPNPMVLRICYITSGTDYEYGAAQCRVLTYRATRLPVLTARMCYQDPNCRQAARGKAELMVPPASA
eukprot:1149906-Rhodomonas_salina.1